jgi:peptidoglycan/LPS O-acetylase OafA/YrhL
MFTICRIDALALGALAAVLVRNCDFVAWVQARRREVRIGALVVIALTIVLTKGAPRAGVLTQTFGYTVFAAAFAALVLDIAIAHPRDLAVRMLSWNPLRSAGKYSYGMYVFHTPFHLLIGLPVLQHLAKLQDINLPLALAYYAAATWCTYGLAVLSYHLLEKHFLRLKKYFEAT